LIESYHLIEHFPRHEFPKILAMWRRLLKSGGVLIIECPDFDECVRKYLNGDESQLDGIFGLQRYVGDTHYFGYSFERLSKLLIEYGFSNVVRKEATDYHKEILPSMRIECTNKK
jgi:predicted SAM-dependent methyltransferase